MTLEQFSEFLYGAVLLDWDVERERIEPVIKEIFDDAAEVRIVGAETDLTLSLTGRHGEIDAAGANMPAVRCSTARSRTRRRASSSSPSSRPSSAGREVAGIRFRFEGGRIVERLRAVERGVPPSRPSTSTASRRLGELGIGCNPGITRYMKNTLFDEKINGTVSPRDRRAFPWLGGTNVSAIHWDIVKDVRQNGRIEVNGKLVQENGEWIHNRIAV